jgi:hypothetical protein
VTCRITDDGLALLAGLDRPVRDAEEAALSALTPKQLQQLIALLDRTRSALQNS